MNQNQTIPVVTDRVESEEQIQNRLFFKGTTLGTLLLAVMFMAQSTVAADFSWLPTESENDWNTPENWTPDGPPGSSNILDTATIPASTTGVINYNSQGSTFANLNVATTNPAVLTINVSAPLVLKDGAIWGGATSQTGLHVVVTSSGSITSLNSTASYSMTLNGGQVNLTSRPAER